MAERRIQSLPSQSAVSSIGRRVFLSQRSASVVWWSGFGDNKQPYLSWAKGDYGMMKAEEFGRGGINKSFVCLSLPIAVLCHHVE